MNPLPDSESAFAAIRAGDRAARERLILAHIPLVRALARRHPRGAEPLEDVVQVGVVGLIKAVDRYESGRGGAFVTFAVPTVLGEIRRHFRDRAALVRLPRAVVEARPRVRMAVDGLAASRARMPEVGEIAAETGLEDALVREVLAAAAARTVPLVDERDDDESVPAARIGVEEPGYPAAEARADLASALGVLPVRERVILHLRFEHDLTQCEIAERVGISQMHVSRLLRRALERLGDRVLAAPPAA